VKAFVTRNHTGGIAVGKVRFPSFPGSPGGALGCAKKNAGKSAFSSENLESGGTIYYEFKTLESLSSCTATPC